MTKYITSILESAGYFGIVFLMFLENVFPPIPSEFIMPLAGFMVTQEKFSLVGIIVAGTFGSVIGALRRSRCFGGVLGHAMGQGKRPGGKLGLPGKFFRADVEICSYPASLRRHPC